MGTTPNIRRRLAAVAVAGLAFVGVVATPAAAFEPTEYSVDGTVVAVRRAPATAGDYGNHGVDYSPTTQP